MTIRQKLLKAIENMGMDILTDEALVDMLIAKIAEQEKEIKRLIVQNAHEKIAINIEKESIRRERHEMRGNPIYGMTAEYFFIGKDNAGFMVNINSGILTGAFQRIDNIHWAMAQVSRAQYDKSVSNK